MELFQSISKFCNFRINGINKTVDVGCVVTHSKKKEKMKLEASTLQELLLNTTNLHPSSKSLLKSLLTTKAGMSLDCVRTTIHQGKKNPTSTYS